MLIGNITWHQGRDAEALARRYKYDMTSGRENASGRALASCMCGMCSIAYCNARTSACQWEGIGSDVASLRSSLSASTFEGAGI